MKKLRHSKPVALLIAFLFVFQLLPIGTALAAGSQLTVGLDGSISDVWLKNLNVKILNPSPNNTEILPVGTTYENIPKDARIQIELDFKLNEGQDGQIAHYSSGDHFFVDLPSGITVLPAGGVIQDNSGETIANWSIENGKVKIVFTDYVEEENNLGTWGKLNVNGSFNEINSTDEEQTEFTIGETTYTINRVPLPREFTMEKRAVGYDASTNEISWEVTVKGPQSEPNAKLNGLTIADSLTSGNHQYVQGSFKFGGDDITPTIDNNTAATYTIPNSPDITAPKVLTYKTTPTVFNGTANTASVFNNTVKLKDSSDHDIATANGTTSLKWIAKSGSRQGLGSEFPYSTKWTVTVTVPGDAGKAVTGAEIIDTLPLHLELDTSKNVMIGTTVVVEGNPGEAGKYYYDTANNKLIYTFPADAQPTAGTNAVLTFYTKVKQAFKDSILDNNSAITFTNTAEFDWTQNPGATNPSANGSVTGVDGNGLVDKSVKSTPGGNRYYFNENGTFIQWQIVVNRNQITMANAAITDTVQAGHKLVIDSDQHKFTVTKAGGGSKEYLNLNETEAGIGTLTAKSDGGFTFTFDPAIGNASTYTITFWTRVDDAKFYTNSNVDFRNNVTLSYNGKTASDYATKTLSTEMLKKSGTYDYNTKKATWTIIVNDNKGELTDAVITETLPNGMTLDPSNGDSIKVYVTSGGAEGNAQSAADAGFTFASTTPTINGFTLTLSGKTTSKYRIVFETLLSDDFLKTSGNWTGNENSHTFTNTVNLKATETGETGITTNGTVTVKNPVITKSAPYTAGNDWLDWTAVINHTNIKLDNGKVEDQLPSSLELVTDSVKLWSVTIGNNGLPTNDKTAVEKADTVDADKFSCTYVGNKLTVNLPTNTSKAYILEFRTNILETGSTITNSITLSDGATIKTGTYTTAKIQEMNAIGGSYSKSITVTKYAEDGVTALEGAKFQLFNSSNVAVKRYNRTTSTYEEITATTNGSGAATFQNLPSWGFKVKEIDPPAGYLFSQTVTKDADLKNNAAASVTFTNKKAEVTIEITKVGANDQRLSGGLFGLYEGQTLKKSVAAASNGKVTFENIEPGTYTIKEINPPAGHVISEETITVTVSVNSGKTDVNVSYGGNKKVLVNKPDVESEDATKVVFRKTDLKGNGLMDGTFVLKGKDYESKDVSVPGVVSEGGIVTFSGVTIANTYYEIFETKTPDGYLNPNGNPGTTPILRAYVYYNSELNGLEAKVVAADGSKDSEIISEFTNAPAVADVSFNKVHANNANAILNGGTFQIKGKPIAGFPVDGEGYYVDTAHAVNGVVTFKDVPVNATGESYTITELLPPGGYLSTNKTLKVTVSYTDDGTKIAVGTPIFDGGNSLENTPIPYVPGPSKAQVIKVDEQGGRLAGATFTLYDAGGSAVTSMTTGSNGIAEFVGLTAGRAYTIRETSAPDGYVLSNESFSFTAQADQTHTFTMTNEKISGEPEEPEVPEVPEEPEIPEVPETPENPTGLSGSLTILKLNRADIPLSGAEFTLYSAAGDVLAIVVSGADGRVRFDYLAPGTYRVAETKAPEGYRLFAEALTVEITAENLNLGYTLRNAAEQDPPEVAGWEDDPVPLGEAPGTLPKTGEVPASVYLLVAGLGLLGTGLVTLLPRKKSDNRVTRRDGK